MADTVSQDQINELLRTMQVQKAAKQESGNSGQREKTKYSKYDFYSPRKFTKDKMKILTSAFENYARVITSQLNGIFRVSTEITVKDVQEGRYYEFVGKLSENDSITLADAYTQEKNKAKVPLMMYVTPGLVITLIAGSRSLNSNSSFVWTFTIGVEILTFFPSSEDTADADAPMLMLMISPIASISILLKLQTPISSISFYLYLPLLEITFRFPMLSEP